MSDNGWRETKVDTIQFLIITTVGVAQWWTWGGDNWRGERVMWNICWLEKQKGEKR